MNAGEARVAYEEAQWAVGETRRLAPDSPDSRDALAALWDARCALRRAVDAASCGDVAIEAAATASAKAAAARATAVARRASRAMNADLQPAPLSPATGIDRAPGSASAARRSPRE